MKDPYTRQRRDTDRPVRNPTPPPPPTPICFHFFASPAPLLILRIPFSLASLSSFLGAVWNNQTDTLQTAGLALQLGQATRDRWQIAGAT